MKIVVVVVLLTNRDVSFTFNCSVAYLAGELSVCGISRKCKTSFELSVNGNML